MNIGKRVTELRERAGLSKYRLAQLIEVDPSLITRIEKDEAKPSLDSLERICNAVGVSMSEFFSDTVAEKIKNLPGNSEEANSRLIEKLKEKGVLNYIMLHEMPKLRDAYFDAYGDDDVLKEIDNLSLMEPDKQISFILRFAENIIENEDGTYTLVVRGSQDPIVIALMDQFNSLSDSDQQFVLSLVERLRRPLI